MTKQNLTDRLLAYLQEHGLVGAREVMRELKISQPTFSRLVAGMHDRLCIVGEARSRRYALRRNLLNFGSEFPIYAISENGEAKHIADLKLIAAKGFLIVSHSDDITSGAFPDIPYWLNDLRPSGFLGRLLPTKHPELGYPSDIRLWSSEACIHYWLTLAWDLIGNLIIGERTFRLYHEHLHRPAQPPSDFSSQDLAAVYKRLAREVLSLGAAGSSAGGEQPKFLTERPGSSQPVLVKFSPPCSNEVQKRRGDLLVCEHICLSTLREQGIPACVSRLVAGSEQIFLELERFDRVAASGRRGVISLGALSAEFVGSSGSWRETAKQLLQKGRINQSAHDQIFGATTSECASPTRICTRGIFRFSAMVRDSQGLHRFTTCYRWPSPQTMNSCPR